MKVVLHKQLYLFLLLLTAALSGCQKEVQDNLNQLPPVADAGVPQTHAYPAPSGITLTGTGTSTNGAIVGYLWSLVSGPNVPEIQSPAAPVTQVTNLVGGRYLFQFMVIDEAGLTGVDTVSLNMVAPALDTLTLQPSNNPTEVNFAGGPVYEGSTHDIDVYAGAWTIFGDLVYLRSAIQFNWSSIPANATIVSAKLSLYSNPTPINGNLTAANSGSNNAFFIRRITSSWLPSTATWNGRPNTTDVNQVYIAHTDQAYLDLPNLDVTGMVNDMRTTNNYGLMLMLENETPYNIRQFCSSIHSNANLHPKLELIYY